MSRLAINDEGFVFDPTTGDSYHVSSTAMLILKGIREGIDDRQIAQMLTKEFDVSLDEAMHDVTDFQNQLKTMALA